MSSFRSRYERGIGIKHHPAQALPLPFHNRADRPLYRTAAIGAAPFQATSFPFEGCAEPESRAQVSSQFANFANMPVTGSTQESRAAFA
jgi:hypothetical protein